VLSGPPGRPASQRRPYIDWIRGFAVLVMIQAHALDAWTRSADRSTLAFGYLMVVGGLAAPLFLWLAGLGLALSAERTLVRGGHRWQAAEGIVRRGLEIFILAFLFRLQAFLVSPGSPLVTIFRVDILNVMGPTMVVAGLLWALARNWSQAVAFSATAATAIAVATPLVRAATWVSALPAWVQWYLRPTGDHTTFTLFPWAGFVFAGAAAGTLLAAGPDSQSLERRSIGLLTLAGALLVALGVYTASQPTIYRASSFWTSSPTYFAIRAGIMMLILGLAFAASPLGTVAPRALGWLEKMGRNSLFIYWIHVELVYGYATWVIHRRLPLWTALLAYALFCTAMYRAIGWRDGLIGRWRSRRLDSSQKSRAEPAQA
jgi:uncharacterized membrane protein